jgi:hypothetical protein
MSLVPVILHYENCISLCIFHIFFCMKDYISKWCHQHNLKESAAGIKLIWIRRNYFLNNSARIFLLFSLYHTICIGHEAMVMWQATPDMLGLTERLKSVLKNLSVVLMVYVLWWSLTGGSVMSEWSQYMMFWRLSLNCQMLTS